jgi:hypothetical protein
VLRDQDEPDALPKEPGPDALASEPVLFALENEPMPDALEDEPCPMELGPLKTSDQDVATGSAGVVHRFDSSVFVDRGRLNRSEIHVDVVVGAHLKVEGVAG